MPIAADMLESYRSHLGPVGVWLGPISALRGASEQQAAARLEQLGYGSIWAGEPLLGKEAFAHMAILLGATERVVIGSGVANIWARLAASMQSGASTLAGVWPGRFVLGLGVSHAPMVERAGQRYERPLERMRGYLAEMDAAAPDVATNEAPVPRLLAALGPRMLALAREQADGAHPYFVPVAHTPAAREALGPEKLLVTEQAVLLTTDRATARSTARAHLARYLGLPNYADNLRRLGYGDDDLAAGGSDRLVDDLVASGDEDAVARRVQAHLDAGADHVLVQPLGEPAEGLPQLERLAPGLLALAGRAG